LCHTFDQRFAKISTIFAEEDGLEKFGTITNNSIISVSSSEYSSYGIKIGSGQATGNVYNNDTIEVEGYARS
jgi:hypothetical protein